MKTEYEVRVLEINKEEIIKRLEELGATKIREYNFKRYVYDLKPADNQKWIRLRTDGKVTTLTYKQVVSNTIDGTKEIEIEVDDFEKTNEFMEKIGFKHKGYQENKRTQYILNEIELDIDSWPMLPPYLEIEGKSEQDVLKMQELLNVDNSKVTALNNMDIYKQIYNIDISKMEVVKF